MTAAANTGKRSLPRDPRRAGPSGLSDNLHNYARHRLLQGVNLATNFCCRDNVAGFERHNRWYLGIEVPCVSALCLRDYCDGSGKYLGIVSHGILGYDNILTIKLVLEQNLLLDPV